MCAGIEVRLPSRGAVVDENYTHNDLSSRTCQTAMVRDSNHVPRVSTTTTEAWGR